MTPSSTFTVYYNTKCPVCDAGIDFQKSRLVKAARQGLLVFRDINLEPEALERFGASVNDVRRRLHGVDSDDTLHVGIDCAIAIWRRTPGDGWLAWIVDRPVARSIAAFGYDRFADLLRLESTQRTMVGCISRRRSGMP